MKILIIGGHLSPALSIIENLKGHEVSYVGRKHALEGDSALSLEYLEITKHGIPFFQINTARVQRKFTRHTILSWLKFPKGFIQSLVILKKIKPDIVLGFGGYVSVPIILAAKLLNVPSVIHEQTFDAGLANRLLSSVAKKVCISWESSRKYFPKDKTVLTGLPIKLELIELKKRPKSINKVPLLYITGGSLGSHKINLMVLNSLATLLKTFSIVHQTGDSQAYRDFDMLQQAKESLPNNLKENYHMEKFLSANEAMNIMYKADIVIARAGINTVCELVYLEKPSLLIPISYSQKNEQLKNATYLMNAGLAEIADEDKISPQDFATSLLKIHSQLARYKITNGISVDFEESARKIIDVIEDVYQEKKT